MSDCIFVSKPVKLYHLLKAIKLVIKYHSGYMYVSKPEHLFQYIDDYNVKDNIDDLLDAVDDEIYGDFVKEVIKYVEHHTHCKYLNKHDNTHDDAVDNTKNTHIDDNSVDNNDNANATNNNHRNNHHNVSNEFDSDSVDDKSDSTNETVNDAPAESDDDDDFDKTNLYKSFNTVVLTFTDTLDEQYHDLNATVQHVYEMIRDLCPEITSVTVNELYQTGIIPTTTNPEFDTITKYIDDTCMPIISNILDTLGGFWDVMVHSCNPNKRINKYFYSFLHFIYSF